MTNIIWGTTKKPVSSQQLAEFFQTNFADDEGELYIGYPIIAAPEGAYPIDALWLSRDHGLVIFCLVEGTTIGEYAEQQDDSANRLETKLRSYQALMQRRTLLAAPNVVTFAPAAQIEGLSIAGYPLCNANNLKSAIEEYKWPNPELLESVLSVIQSISTIRKGRRTRNIVQPDSKGAKLKALEDSIANLDNVQGRAVIETVDGVQRIRGLAGSGKTIILALKAAYLHTQHPDWRIAVTFNTRSLKEQFRRLINTFVIEQSGEEPIWSNITILNAWGASGGEDRTGIYFKFVQAHGINYEDFQIAKRQYGYDDAFAGVCKAALAQITDDIDLFDVILVDEAQDFDPSFLRMCYSLLSGNRRLVYAYDELQSLNDSSLPPPDELFGFKPDGSPIVHFAAQADGQPQQDIILEKCYRNSRPVLATAHALGFGVYRLPDPKTGTGLIQMFDQKKLWLDVGYSVVSGSLLENHQVRLARTPETSPVFLESHSAPDALIQFMKFDDKQQQAEWLANSIANNLEKDELEPDDIIVINPDPISTRKEVGSPRRLLFEKGIESHLAGVDVSPDIFFDVKNASVAFTGIFRAKGNEAGMVYIMNAHHCGTAYGSLARVRNQLFTAITRSKGWVRVLGVGDQMQVLIDEFESVKAKGFELDFVYPSEELRGKINVVNRDMTEAEKNAAKSSSDNLQQIIIDLEDGKILVDDLPVDVVKRLRFIFGSNANNE